MDAAQLSCKLVSVIIDPLLALFFAVAVLVFVWGLVEFLTGLARGEADKEKGRRHMLWGIAGLFIMTVATVLVQVTIKTIGGYNPNLNCESITSPQTIRT